MPRVPSPARIVILDPKDGIRPIGPGFKAAFDELYPDIITHVPNARVESMDPYAKRIKTTAGEWEFEDAILMVPHQAGELVWMADLIVQKQIDLNDRSPDLVARDFEWVGGMYQDLFG